MTWQEFWQTTVANLRALFGGRTATYSPPPPLPEETAVDEETETGTAQPSYPRFPTVWEEPTPAATGRTLPAPTTWEPPVETLPAPPLDTPEAAVEAETEAARDEPAHAHISPAPAAESVETEDAAPLLEDRVEDRVEDQVEEQATGEPGGEPAQPHAALADERETAKTPDAPDEPTLSMVLESVLFVASEPVTPAHLARSLNISEAEVHAELETLAEHYRASGRGLRLQMLNGKVQLVTAPAVAAYVEAFLNLDATTRLSGPALETLAVVAYRQPVTRAQVEAIRGVDCSGVLRSLVQRGLIAEVGRLESAGRPILYGVTELFMQHFGLADLKDLPPLEESEADRLWAASLLADPDSEPPPSQETPPDEPA